MKTVYRSPYVVVVDTEDTSDTYLDAEKPISTRLFSAKVAWGLLSPVDCSYTLFFERGEEHNVFVSISGDNPHTAEEKAKFLAPFATFDKVTIKNLRAVVREPQGPHCKVVGGNLQLRVGTQTITWPTVTIKNLSWLGTAHLAAICNPHKCNVRIKAVGPNEHKVTYFTAGKAMTPGDLFEYEYLELISAEPSEEN